MSSSRAANLSMSHQASSFMALPNEIILMVLDHVYARDLESLAATNSRIRGVAHLILNEHRSLKHSYSTITVGITPYRSLEYLVLRVARDWRTAQYIERLRVYDWLRRWPTTGSNPRANFPMAELGKLNLRMSRAFNCTLKAYSGDEDGILALLIFILPRLEILEVNVGTRDCLCLTSALEDLRNVQIQKTLVGAREAPKNLRTVRIWDSISTVCRFPILHAVLQLPSIKTAEFTGLQLNHRETLGMNLDFEPNNLTTLSFNDCRISSKVIDSVLTNMEGLRNFSFVTHVAVPNYLPIDPYFIQDGLRSASQHTLRRLRILGCYSAQPADKGRYQYMGSLQGFRALEHVTVDLEALFDEREKKIESLWTQLPESIRTAELHSHVEADFNELLQDTPIGRCLDRSFDHDPMYPELSLLELCGMSPTSEARYLERTSKLRSNGVFVEIWA